MVALKGLTETVWCTFAFVPKVMKDLNQNPSGFLHFSSVPRLKMEVDQEDFMGQLPQVQGHTIYCSLMMSHVAGTLIPQLTHVNPKEGHGSSSRKCSNSMESPSPSLSNGRCNLTVSFGGKLHND